MVNFAIAAIFVVLGIWITATKGVVLGIPLFVVALCFVAYQFNERRRSGFRLRE